MSNPFEFYLVETEPQYILASRKKDTRNSPRMEKQTKVLGRT
jgi:adenylate kinase